MNTLKKYWLTVFFLVGLFSTLAYAIYPLPANEDTTEAGNVIEKISKVKKVPLTFVPEKSSQTPPPVSEIRYTESTPGDPTSDTEPSHDHNEDLNPELAELEAFFGDPEYDVSYSPIDDFPVPESFKKEADLATRQMKEQGYIDTPESRITPIRDELTPKSKKYEKTYEEAVELLSLEPSNLEGTPFYDKKVVSRQVSGTYNKGKWSTLSRVYEFENLILVELSEDDYTSGHGKVVFAEDSINEDINGNPAIFEVEVSPSGKAVTSLVWATDSKYYKLIMEKNASSNEDLKGEFLNLARSVPID
ncbi:conserved hypothetical protein [Bathymodiolus platifrons methanotrophic gill symbiont]|uniref:hypothetical protein n=1 Tax=Bathymodiolus platifrons methanotrophic gill symbiont TaxID=113268 RepID=UPI000B421425|nr:hypothetical protein [Bathymodiolus platifrons methanotrophic gill symbiont]GAW87834.1 conserved hypothetical protein [Bathymodiolus platifrons methanotrophic gill symbiont]